jgi:RNA polymerase sigma-70 factor (ECF subfamily)
MGREGFEWERLARTLRKQSASSALHWNEEFMSDFAEKLEANLPRLRQYALVLTKDGSAADDLVQSTVLRGLENEHLWMPGTDLRAWLFTIMHNLFVSEVRRSSRNPVLLMSSVADHQSSQPSQDGRLGLRDLDRALAQLPKAQLEIVIMIGLEGMSYGDAGRALGIPLGTVRSRLSRAREMLRTMMGLDQESIGERRQAAA